MLLWIRAEGLLLSDVILLLVCLKYLQLDFT